MSLKNESQDFASKANVTKKAFAKINLTLDILGKRPDGYHNIETLMINVTLCDDVQLEFTQKPGVTEVVCDYPGVPQNGNNIVCKAAQAFFEQAGIANPGVRFCINKSIPTQAGLAGGSTDAAAALRLLNEAFCSTFGEYKKPDCTAKKGLLPEDMLYEIGAKIGADVPFCLAGGLCLCTGTGIDLEKLATPNDLEKYSVVLIKPEISVSTKDAYAIADTLPPKAATATANAVNALQKNNTLASITDIVSNDFETALQLPEIKDIKKELLQNGAVAASMSGSGSAGFGLFTNESIAQTAAKQLKQKYADVFVCGFANN
ncbi:MAG: 4-(cytidine 5'-diphospho)-2-C-methyl-D-erythritol kinase [Oscillospiraceae bacterium]|jgi:4-diphosphocytidyl-2-C-methyl-D-erythritol kinase|nr:4-(cytidine 5'-diphospho)-2-C-methyl-D-erythritol kinase [Oscillospiraceae bacterium]